MAEYHFTWKQFASSRALLMALIFGLLGVLTLWVDLRIPILPAQNIAADTREIFVVLGAALTGPLGGAIAGGVSALYSPQSTPMLHLSTWLAHSMAGLALGWVYRLVQVRWEWPRFLLFWAKCVLVYYLVLVSVFIFSVFFLVPALASQIAGPEASPAWGYFILATSVLPETLFIFLFTSVVMIALPRKYRSPVWQLSLPA